MVSNYCIDCGVPISKNAVRCRPCNGAYQSMRKGYLTTRNTPGCFAFIVFNICLIVVVFCPPLWPLGIWWLLKRDKNIDTGKPTKHTNSEKHWPWV
jgi:hypothetical protein